MRWQNSMIEAYLYAFVNWEQNDWTRLLLIVEFAYNNFKNAHTGHTSFELNCSYYPCVFFKDKYNICSRSFSAKRLVMELRKLMNVCYQNFLHTKDLQKQTHDKKVKSQSYVLSEKVWLNSKHIKTKRNRKLKAKFFGPFHIFYLVGK